MERTSRCTTLHRGFDCHHPPPGTRHVVLESAFRSPKGILQTLLSRLYTLVAYPQFAGRIEEIPLVGERDITRERHGRFSVTYGTLNDPGIEVLLARCDTSIAHVLPVSEKRHDQLPPVLAVFCWPTSCFRDVLVGSKRPRPGLLQQRGPSLLHSFGPGFHDSDNGGTKSTWYA